MRLGKRRCKIEPTLEEIQSILSRIVLNVVQTHYGISTWGKLAKTEERIKRRPLFDEIKHERTWFKMISEHKQIQEYMDLFAGGLMLLDVDVNRQLVATFNKYEYLWKQNPFEVPMEEKPELIEKIQLDLQEMVDHIQVGPILILLGLVQKNILRKFLSYYKKRMDEISEFIQDHDYGLSKTLKELDDIKIAIEKIKIVQDRKAY